MTYIYIYIYKIDIKWKIQCFAHFYLSVSTEATTSINNNDLPILSQMISFNLTILTICDRRSIAYTLCCMPNLIHFSFHLAIQKATWPYPGELLNGFISKDIFEVYVPYLSKFEVNKKDFKSAKKK